MPRYDVTVVPADGNAFSIMGAVTNVMKRHGATKVEVDAYLKDAMSGDYDHLLQTSMAMVRLESSYPVPDDDDIEDDEDICPDCDLLWEDCEC